MGKHSLSSKSKNLVLYQPSRSEGLYMVPTEKLIRRMNQRFFIVHDILLSYFVSQLFNGKPGVIFDALFLPFFVLEPAPNPASEFSLKIARTMAWILDLGKHFQNGIRKKLIPIFDTLFGTWKWGQDKGITYCKQ